jgi:hypothetical protein
MKLAVEPLAKIEVKDSKVFFNNSIIWSCSTSREASFLANNLQDELDKMIMDIRLELKKYLSLADEETVIGGIRNMAQVTLSLRGMLGYLEENMKIILSRFPDNEIIDALVSDHGLGHRKYVMNPPPTDEEIKKWRLLIRNEEIEKTS